MFVKTVQKLHHRAYNIDTMARDNTKARLAEYEKYRELYSLYAAGYSHAEIGLYIGIERSLVTKQLRTLSAKYPSLFGNPPTARSERYSPEYHDDKVRK